MRSSGGLSRGTIALLLLSVSGSVMAFPPFLTRFIETYKPTAGSHLATAKCATCHQTPQGGDRNPFGKAVEAQLDASGTQSLTAAMLLSIEPLDSDGDGATNLDEIRAGSLPGDGSDKPAEKPATTAAPAEPDPLIPGHSFHPVFVHFPIALFIFGAFLDLLGMRRKDGALRRAAVWNLAVGSLSTLAAVTTGLIAANRLGYGWLPGGSAFTHFAIATAGTILAASVAIWRTRRTPEGGGYILLLLLAAGLLGLAGHFGGSLVYG